MYKLSFLLLLLSILGFMKSESEVYDIGDSIEAVIRKVLECVKIRMKDSPLDPLYMKDREIVLDRNQWVQGHYYIISWVLRGLSDFEVKEMDVSAPRRKLKYSLLFDLDLTGKYRADGSMIYVAPFNGEGDINVKLGLNISGNMTFKLSPPRIDVFELRLGVLPDFNITGLIYDEYMSWLMSKQLDLIVNDVFNCHWEEISSIVSPIVKTVLNFLLSLMLESGSETFDESDDGICANVNTVYEALITKQTNIKIFI